MAAVAWMTIVLTIVLLAFYTWNPLARNYGGSTQGRLVFLADSVLAAGAAEGG